MYNFRAYTEEEKVALENMMCQGHEVLKKLSEKRFRAIHCLRKDYLNKSLILNDSEERNAFNSIHAIEEDVIACYGKLALQIAKKYFRKEKMNKPEVEFQDYAQEAILSLVRASYYYNGEHRFSTFAGIVIQNRMREYIRENCPLSKVKKRIVRLGTKLHKLMNDEGLTFDAASEKMQLTRNDKQELMQSLVKAVSDAKWDFMIADVKFSSNSIVDNKLAERAIQEVELSDFERDILEAKLNNEPISSVTDRYQYTRMAGTHALKRVYKAIKSKYDELSRAA